ncbi:hypothetical protein RND71_015767 [Anisodus tanguticus]|uniref:Uncharacterized protein n=1 Tax=Anisodus tanguticus TaxID=243964 RepID=A0AAE1S4V9_9SOLA|nr:hypothetical protein RND71_015767 [Anisodus tanguticus]
MAKIAAAVRGKCNNEIMAQKCGHREYELEGADTAEVRKERSKLEMTCLDMASVLCGLGISVGDGTSLEAFKLFSPCGKLHSNAERVEVAFRNCSTNL